MPFAAGGAFVLIAVAVAVPVAYRVFRPTGASRPVAFLALAITAGLVCAIRAFVWTIWLLTQVVIVAGKGPGSPDLLSTLLTRRLWLATTTLAACMLSICVGLGLMWRK